MRLAAPNLMPLVTGKSAPMLSQINQGQRTSRNTPVSAVSVNPSGSSGVVAINQAKLISATAPMSVRSKGRITYDVVFTVRYEIKLTPQ